MIPLGLVLHTIILLNCFKFEDCSHQDGKIIPLIEWRLKVAYLHELKTVMYLIATGNKYTSYIRVSMYISLKSMSSFHLFHVSKIVIFRLR